MLNIRKFTFNPLQENTYVLYDEETRSAAIVDPGCYFEEERLELDGFIQHHRLSVTHIIQTHCHLDHVFGLAWAVAHYGISPSLHTLEQRVLSLAPASGQIWNLPFEGYQGPVHLLEENDTVEIGKNRLKVLFVPGHSPGHVCFYNQDQDWLMGGDVLFDGSIGRTDLPGGNHTQLISRIQSELLVLPEATVVHPGHGPATTIGKEKSGNPFL